MTNWVHSNWMKALTISSILFDFKREKSTFPDRCKGPYINIYEDRLELSICGFGLSKKEQATYNAWDILNQERQKLCDQITTIYDVVAQPTGNVGITVTGKTA